MPVQPPKPGWQPDDLNPETRQPSPDVEQPPRRASYPPSEYSYDLPPGYTDRANATARTRLMRTGDPEGRLIEDFAPGAVLGYRDRPPAKPDPQARARTHTPPRVQ